MEGLAVLVQAWGTGGGQCTRAGPWEISDLIVCKCEPMLAVGTNVDTVTCTLLGYAGLVVRFRSRARASTSETIRWKVCTCTSGGVR